LRSVVEAIHEAQIDEHGGAPGLRDEGLLESALARPESLLAYVDGDGDVVALACAYASAIIRNHPFVDGNKRTGFLTAYVFLRQNGVEIVAEEGEAATAVLRLASGEMEEAEFVEWLRGRTAVVGEADGQP
jgi:death-on-curing protein